MNYYYWLFLFIQNAGAAWVQVWGVPLDKMKFLAKYENLFQNVKTHLTNFGNKFKILKRKLLKISSHPTNEISCKTCLFFLFFISNVKACFTNLENRFWKSWKGKLKRLRSHHMIQWHAASVICDVAMHGWRVPAKICIFEQMLELDVVSNKLTD